MDAKMLRDEAENRNSKRFQHKYTKDQFTLAAPADFTALHLWGGSGLGKTKFGLAQFENPCLVKPFNSVGAMEQLMKSFDKKIHDGLVLDEVNLSFLSREETIALLDTDEEATFSVRYKSFTLPAGLRKILISNPPPTELYSAHDVAITRRRTDMHITTPTFAGPNHMRHIPTPVTTVNGPPMAHVATPTATPPTQVLAAVPAAMAAWAGPNSAFHRP